MSYCRMGDDSDVYMFNHVDGFIECCACKLLKDFHAVKCDTPSDALSHLEAHINSGHKVPQYAIDRLTKEINND